MKGLYKLTHGTDELVILGSRADGDAQTVFAQLHATAVAHNDTLIHQIVIDALGIVDTHQEEVGIGGINSLAIGQCR